MALSHSLNVICNSTELPVFFFLLCLPYCSHQASTFEAMIPSHFVSCEFRSLLCGKGKRLVTHFYWSFNMSFIVLSLIGNNIVDSESQ